MGKVFDDERQKLYEDRIRERIARGETVFGEQEVAVIAAKFGMEPEDHPFMHQHTDENSPTAGRLGSDPHPDGAGRAYATEEEREAAEKEDGDKTTGEPIEGDYDDHTVEELQNELRRRDLPVSGTKPELVERLTENDEHRE